MLIQECVARYSIVGDITAMLISVVLMIIIYSNLSFSEDYGLKLHKRAIILVFLASYFNIIYSQLVKFAPDYGVGIYLSRELYHILLNFVFLIFANYVRRLLALTKEKDRKICWISWVATIGGSVLNLISPITHWGLYKADNGMWYETLKLSPFVVTYVFFIVLLAVALIYFKTRLIAQVRLCLCLVEGLCMFIMMVPNSFYRGTFTTITFFFPMLALLIMIHSLPYELETGARYGLALNHYLAKTNHRGKKTMLLVLKLYMENDEKIPQELGHVMYTFYRGSLNRASLFRLGRNTYILGVPDEAPKRDTMECVRELIEQQFPKQYARFQIPYRIMLMECKDFIQGTNELEGVIAYFETKVARNKTLICDDEMMIKLRNVNVIINQLRMIHNNLDLNDERVLCYVQPVKNVVTGEFDTAEALMRLKLPGIGMIYPDRFIPLAEQYGYIHSLGLIMLNKVCRLIRELEEKKIKMERVSINFTMRDLQKEHFVEEVIGIIAQNHVPFDKIAIEITESQTAMDFEVTMDRIDQLREYGIVFYLDDFGTGYTNFERVLRMNLDIVKFDRTLLLSVKEDKNNSFILHHFAEAFEQLDYKILFEGIETDDQEQICRNAHADYLQGYMYSKPMPSDKLAEFILGG
ncbi:EAL domain-containing protein [Eubacterium oxidoreducens]|uniref:EAL domain, c-di-GMP-specific phosphodiesterase class I (Or its enzymatically inactive variant) n=1 Tax=Eubacterium oxidoreducens TaxID=1732 RepID=A0A1G6BX60_EUBOX|nr:EAL domain-containing protein [Eubacterium oxidoreducens]SDB25226.1 EAL domain, c-di-GMP-specific phosphodiesterase class I (or its enzymatically inactive variant) [Eubacterium oxidoreducens]